MIKILFWSPVNFNNLANGSTTWSENIIKSLISINQVEVTVLLKDRYKMDRLKKKGVKFIVPPKGKKVNEDLSWIKLINRIHNNYNYIVIRTGVLLYTPQIFRRLLASKFIKKCIFFYLFSTFLSPVNFNRLYNSSHRIYTFNNYTRDKLLTGYVQSIKSEKPILTYLPILTQIKDQEVKILNPTKIKIIYAGSAKSNYLVNRFQTIFTKVSQILNKKNIKIQVDIYGISNKKSNKIIKYHGVVNHGKLLRILPQYDYGIALVSSKLINCPQISSKVLEYCSQNVFPLCNKYLGNSQFLGEDFSYLNSHNFPLSIAKIIQNHILDISQYNATLELYNTKCSIYSVKGNLDVLSGGIL